MHLVDVCGMHLEAGDAPQAVLRSALDEARVDDLGVELGVGSVLVP